MLKSVTTAAAAVSLIVSPTMAAAQTAPVEVAPASESIDGNSELRGGFIIPLIAIIAIILGILAATNDDDDDLPHTP